MAKEELNTIERVTITFEDGSKTSLTEKGMDEDSPKVFSDDPEPLVQKEEVVETPKKNRYR